MTALAAAVPRLPRPWLDKKGRFHDLRAAVFALLLLPGLVVVGRWGADALGAEPAKAALKSLGFWATWLLLASLTVSPAKAVLGLPNLVVVRRMVGLGAMAYALLHLSLYVAHENWRVLHVAGEIALRFYLTIGFAALVGLAVLGWTSSDEWVRRLGKRWKRLHKWVYLLAALAVFHFYLQSKLDVSRAVLASGVFVWVMLWRLLPVGRDRGLPALLGLAVASAALTLGMEFAWYALATKADPWRVFWGEFDVAFGLRPAGQVLALGLLVVAAVALRRLSQSAHAGTAWVAVAVCAGGGGVVYGVLYALNLLPDLGLLGLEDGAARVVTGVWLGLFGLLGLAGRRLAEAWQRRWLDVLWAAWALYPLYGWQMDRPEVVLAGSAAVGLAALAVSARLWPVSRPAALLVAPVAAWVAYAATSFL